MNLLGGWKKIFFSWVENTAWWFLKQNTSHVNSSVSLSFPFLLLQAREQPWGSFLAGWGNLCLPRSSSHPSQVQPGAGPGAGSGCDQSTVLRTPLHPSPYTLLQATLEPKEVKSEEWPGNITGSVVFPSPPLAAQNQPPPRSLPGGDTVRTQPYPWPGFTPGSWRNHCHEKMHTLPAAPAHIAWHGTAHT